MANNKKVLNEENNEIHLEYWLSEQGGKFQMNDNFTLFGVGKRDCPGQSVAIKSMYSIFGLMINNYKFIAEHDAPDEMNIKQIWTIVLAIDPPIGLQVELR